MQSVLMWLAARQFANAQKRYFGLRGDLPYTREPYAAAEARVEAARLRVLARKARLDALQGPDMHALGQFSNDGPLAL